MARKHKYGIADRRVIGLICGIVSGIAYGTNPLFAKPLLQSGVPILVMLFFRYGFSALILGMWILGRKEAFHIQKSEIGILSLLGLLFAGSSIFLFASYEFIPSGLATTLVYLYPVFVALIMVFLRFYPSWQTWLSIIATFGGILLLSSPSQGSQIRLPGIILAVVSALCYSFYLVIVNRSSRIRHVSENTLTLYALFAGTALFAILRLIQGGTTVCDAQWPVCNEEYLKESVVKYTVSFNGKPRFNIEVPAGTDKAEVERIALTNEGAARWLDGKTPKKVIVVPNKIVNVVV